MNTLKRITNIVSTIMIILAVLAAAALAIPKVLGYQSYAVISPSMKPKYPTGSMVYAKPVDVNTLKIDDVIVFEFTTTVPATHRIKNIVYNEDGSLKGFQTKGDNSMNDNYDQPEDRPLSPSKVIGRVDFGIPVIGFLLTYAKHPAVLIPYIVVMVLLLFLPDIVSWIKKMSEGTDTKNESL